MTGAQFEVRIDGTPRTYRDRKDFAMEAGQLIKSKQPHSILQSGDVTAGLSKVHVVDRDDNVRAAGVVGFSSNHMVL